MNTLKQWAAAPARRRRLLLIGLLLLGLVLTGFFGLRALRSFGQFQYLRRQGVDHGTASVDAVRPWMTVRFLAVAYGVPEDYLYRQLGIPPDPRNAKRPLGRLNEDYHLGQAPTGGAVLVEKAKAAIRAYRAQPVIPGPSPRP